MKTYLTTGLSALCVILLTVMLVLQTKEKSQIETLRQEHKDFVANTEQRQHEARNAVSKLADQVATLGTSFDSRLAQNAQQSSNAMFMLSDKVLSLATNWEAELTPRLNAKSDEVVAAFSVRLNEKANEAAVQVANAIRIQAEAALNASAVDHSNKTVRLLEAASRHEKDGRPELVELCYLSALKCSDGYPGVVLKPMLAWKERSVEAMSENDLLTKSPAMLMALYETLDKVLPDSSALPEDMDSALAVTDRIQGRIVERQQTKLNEIRGKLSWKDLAAESLAVYEQSKEILTSLSPANARLQNTKSELLKNADNLIQTARALNSFSTSDILPPSPKAPVQALTNWFERGLAFITSSTNTLEAKAGAASVLMDFAHNQKKIPECNQYAEALTNESVKLACAEWSKRVNDYGSLLDKKDKPDADTFAVGQSLLNQGFAILKSFTNKKIADLISTPLTGLASKLYSKRELLLVNQMRLVNAPDAFSSKEQAARGRSQMYGQVLNGIFELRSLQSEIVEECPVTAGQLATLRNIEGRYREYLAAYEKLDKADGDDAKADQLTKQRQQYHRYADYCRNKKDSAYASYVEAKNTPWATWGNAVVQQYLSDGLSDLYSVDINDLNRADPGLAAEWSAVEETLKKHYNGSPSRLNELTRKKNISDF